jgi:nucleoid-associated protein YgaU
MRILLHARGSLKSGLLVSLILLCAAASFAQDLGQIARQERERKKEHAPRATYVYTNDDLQRQQILIPKDQARMLAARTAAANPAVEAAQAPASGAPLAVAASPAPASIPPAPVSAPATASASPQVASTKAVTFEPPASPLEAIVRLVREAAAQKRPPTRRSARPVMAYPPFGVRPPAARTRTVHQEIVASLVSRPVFPRLQRHYQILERQPIDLGMADIVTVEPGDSLWKLAKRYLGRGARWRELAALNTQIVNANVLQVGEWICLPAGNLQNARQTIAPRARAPANMAQKICPDQNILDHFVVTAEPLGGPVHHGVSPGRCRSTP